MSLSTIVEDLHLKAIIASAGIGFYGELYENKPLAIAGLTAFGLLVSPIIYECWRDMKLNENSDNKLDYKKFDGGRGEQ